MRILTLFGLVLGLVGALILGYAQNLLFDLVRKWTGSIANGFEGLESVVEQLVRERLGIEGSTPTDHLKEAALSLRETNVKASKLILRLRGWEGNSSTVESARWLSIIGWSAIVLAFVFQLIAAVESP
jgi:hypothetical protein